MKILLCVVNNPSFLRFKATDLAVYPPLGLGYIASCLLARSHTVKIIDNNILQYDQQEFMGVVREFQPDFIGFTTYTLNFNNTILFAKAAKAAHPGCKIILGGPHATYLSYETLSNDAVDMVIAGEGERAFADTLDALERSVALSSIPGLWYKQDGQIIGSSALAAAPGLDGLPFPAYHLMEMDRYYQSIHRKFTDRRFATVITSRGCPYQCTFCSHDMFGKKVRFRSPENVIAELELLTEKFGVGELMFVDDSFTIDKERVLRLCDLINRRNIDIVWTANVRADNVSPEMFSAMRSAGCRSILIGAESGTQEMLDAMKKGTTLETLTYAVKLAKRHIGQVVCSFIFGMPGENLDHSKQTLAFAKELNPDYAVFTIACPAPGSEMFEMAVKKGLIKKNAVNWDHFSVFYPYLPTVNMSDIPDEVLVRLVKRALTEFYLRPQYIISRLIRLRSLSGIRTFLRGIVAGLNYLISRV
jgi:anaerobic magnesium-protoporphyrin IX monomethyl ester cyclase